MATPTGKTFKWMLWPSNGRHSGASDEFIADGFRVRLSGSMLEMTCEAPGGCSPESARALADQYAKELGMRVCEMLHVMTEPDWLERTSPPFQQSATISHTQDDRMRVARAIREARNELLRSADGTLRKCYDHLQDAREHMNEATDQAAVSAYKALEELETHFGSEAGAVAALEKEFKVAKRVANQQRHVAGKYQPTPNAPPSPVELATEVIRNYERHLLGLL